MKDQLIDAIKSGDLIAARKCFASVMAEKIKQEVDQERVAIAKSFVMPEEEAEEAEETQSQEEPGE